MGLFSNIFGGGKKKQLIQQLIAMQRFLYATNSNELTKKPDQILSRARSFVEERRDKIVNAAKQLVSTDNPKKALDSIEKINEILKELEYLDSLSPGIVGGLYDMKNKLNQSFPDDIDNMIDRCWESHRVQAIKLTKEESKKRKLQSFFELMDIYKNKMYIQNIDHIERIKKEFETMY